MSSRGSGGSEGNPGRRVSLAPDLEISPIVTGLWQIADAERDGEAGGERIASWTRVLGEYADRGLTTFDMADHYGSAELIAGRFEATDPGRAQFLTKWVPSPGTTVPGAAREAVERALERMGGRIDLLQYHAWSYDDPVWLDHVFDLDELRNEGLIGHLGVTNMDAIHLRMLLASGVKVATNQVSLSLLDRRACGALTELCLESGVGLLAYGTLAGGLLTRRALDMKEAPASEMPTWSLMKYRRFVDAAGGWSRFRKALDTLVVVAERIGADPAPVAMRWALDSPAVAAVIVGSRLSASDPDNRGVFGVELGKEDRRELDAAFGELDPIPGDCGDEYRRPPFLTAAGDLSHHFDRLPNPYEVRRAAEHFENPADIPSGAGGKRTCDLGPGDSNGSRTTDAERLFVSSGTVWEDMAGYSRAIGEGRRVWVSGTTATHANRLIGGNCAASQTHFCIDKIAGALRSLGASLEDVVRTRLFVTDMSRWEEVARAHGRRFGKIRPANTLVGAELVGEGYLVEIEAEAVVRSTEAELDDAKS